MIPHTYAMTFISALLVTESKFPFISHFDSFLEGGIQTNREISQILSSLGSSVLNSQCRVSPVLPSYQWAQIMLPHSSENF